MPQRKSKLFEPWAPPQAELPEVVAIKALSQGVATADQQQLALHFILVKVCAVDDEPFCPGEDGRRSTDYALGKRRVGTYIRSLLAADIRKFKEDGMPSKQVE
jgi:hypothetical protein